MLLNNFRFIVKELNIKEEFKDKLEDIRVIFIGVEDNQTKIVIPHPITNFIKVKYEYLGKSLNSQNIPARIVCRFLNFILNRIEEKDDDFIPLKHTGTRGLKLKHGSIFITSLTTKGLSRATVLQHERILTNFYIYLKEYKLINQDFPIDIKYNQYQKRIYESIFRDSTLQLRLPSKYTVNSRNSKLKDFGERRYEYASHFINIARKSAPDIAFGVCLQFFGGLRRGEVVNLTRGNIHDIDRNSLTVEIRDNRDSLFSHLQDTKNEYPKRLNYLQTNMCKQSILVTDLIWEVYEEHKKMLQVNSKNIKNRLALFVDKDGKAMSGKVYERRFKKIKRHFLDSLLNADRYSDYILFSESYWSTHIGRGVFTNFLLDIGLSITQIAIARGDRNINSALKYIDEKLSTEVLKNAVEELKEIPQDSIGTIDDDLVKKIWMDGVLKREKRFSCY